MNFLKILCCTLMFAIFSLSTAFAGDVVDLQQGKWLLKYDRTTGDADYIYQGKTILEHVNSVAYLDKRFSGSNYAECTVEKTTVNDAYGTGVCYTVTRTKAGAPALIQHFYLYDNKDYFLTDIELSDSKELASNYLCPVSTARGYESSVLGSGDDRVLIIPFDNDKWVRYRSASLRGGVNSNEVTAVYNAGTRNGIVIGSVEHDVWKSGIRVESDRPEIISRIEFYTGATGEATRDVLPHGKVKGLRIRSPKVLFGYFQDWRDGMEEFGRACAALAPPLSWNLGKPFGWNSWGKMAFQLTYEKILEVSDFYKHNLQNNNFENDSVVYIGLDSGWNRMTDEQLSNFVQHCKANHQKAGIYYTPFSDWGKNPEKEIEGVPGWKCKDAYLYANGHIQNSIAGGWAMDPTHPANDPDYFMLESASDGENRARITSTAITGIVMCGDDFSQVSGLKETADKAKKWMTNKEIMQMARECKSFRPVSGSTDIADFVFTYNTGKDLYIAVFNYSGFDLTYNIPLTLLGLDAKRTYNFKELWFGRKLQAKDTFHIEIPKKDVRVYRFPLKI